MRNRNDQSIIREPSGRVRVISVNNEKALTQQSWKEQCDVNRILEKHARTGLITHLAQNRGAYMDLSKLTSYQDMLEKVRSADEAFLSLPASLRSRFRNDPAALIEFLNDPNSREEAIKLGLLEKPKTSENQNLNPKPKPKTVPKSKNQKPPVEVEPDDSQDDPTSEAR